MGMLNTSPAVRLNATFAPAPPDQGTTASSSRAELSDLPSSKPLATSDWA